MFTKITTTALLAGLALATATTLPVCGAMAHTTSASHGGKSAGGGHSSSAGRGDHSGDRGDRADRGGDRGGDRSFGGGNGGAAGTLGTALGVAHALGIPGFRDHGGRRGPDDRARRVPPLPSAVEFALCVVASTRKGGERCPPSLQVKRFVHRAFDRVTYDRARSVPARGGARCPSANGTGMVPRTRRNGSEMSVMFRKIATTTLIAGLALGTVAALPLAAAMAHDDSHGSKTGSTSHGSGHSSSASSNHSGGSGHGDHSRDSVGGGSGGGNTGGSTNGTSGAVGTALGVAHALGIPGF